MVHFHSFGWRFLVLPEALFEAELLVRFGDAVGEAVAALHVNNCK